MKKFDNKIVHKPWGYEYLAYENDDVGVWLLHINPFKSTSMHCHTHKTTGLIVLQGQIEISFIGDSMILSKLEKRMIRRGLFHSSKSTVNTETILLEIETPNDKEDLVRLNDEYGRHLKPYEVYQEKQNEKSIVFLEPINTQENQYIFAECSISIEKISNINSIFKKHDTDLLIFLKGGIETPTKQRVVIPGDVGYAKIVKQVLEKIPYLNETTMIMTIKNI
jgi:mannose-6-phosphate isomerase-like protein (cupin superfamily)